MTAYTIALHELTIDDVLSVGGKNASLGEMLQNLSGLGISVPDGFATTADAYREFLSYENLSGRIADRLSGLKTDDVAEIRAAGGDIRRWIMEVPFPEPVELAIDTAFGQLKKTYAAPVSWAVRSSATAEDLPDASFAGQQETYLNVSGLENIKTAIRRVFASLFNDRAISYREHRGYGHDSVALSAGVQKMVRSDVGASGVMFTLDTESGFRDVVFITGSYGLGEMVVQGAVNPDELYVHKATLEAGRPAVIRRTLGSKAEKMIYSDAEDEKVTIASVNEDERNIFCIDDADVQKLAAMAMSIERHYDCPMDIEWAKDGRDGEIYIVQARPETVYSQSSNTIEKFTLKQKGRVLAEGRSIGNRIGVGKVRLMAGLDGMESFVQGDVLLTDMTDPDWEPIMKRASAIVTDRGGRTCHAAIIARELGVPAVVGCGDATKSLANGSVVTVSCAEGDTGFIYAGKLEFIHDVQSLDAMPDVPVKIMMNVGNPARAFDFSQLPSHGVGLARLEFIINNMIGIHPKALMQYEAMPAELQRAIQVKTRAYGNPVDFYIRRIAEGVSTIAAAYYPNPVIVRMSDFKSNEYANLVGGREFEPEEENPMIGLRGASRYISDDFRACFELECKAMLHVREDMGFTNIELMIPFVRTVDEARKVIDILKENGLERGKNGLRLIMMCELPSNAILASEFLKYFDGFSIGSNDMTQLTLGLDRDSGLVANLFDERNPAVLAMLEMSINACRAENKYVGICGQGPSDHPEFAAWLLDKGVSSISLNPDTVVETWLGLSGGGNGRFDNLSHTGE